MIPDTTITALAFTLALSPTLPPQPVVATVVDGEPELVRAEIIPADDSAVLLAYDADDNVAAEIAISADGRIQASIDGVFVDAEVTPDGTLVVQCHGACTDTERAAAAARIATIGLLVDNSPHAGKTAGMWCAIGIASTAAACVGSSGLLCGVGFAATACACMKEVVINGKDICE